MFDHIEEQFSDGLRQENSDVFPLRVQTGLCLQLDSQAVIFLHPAAKPSQGCGKAALLQNGGREFGCQGTGSLNRLGDEIQDIFSSLLLFRTDTRGQNFAVNFGCNQNLLQVVVQDFCQTPSLALLGKGQLQNQGSELFCPPLSQFGALGHLPFQGFIQLSQILFGLLAVGDVLQIGQQLTKSGLTDFRVALSWPLFTCMPGLPGRS